MFRTILGLSILCLSATESFASQKFKYFCYGGDDAYLMISKKGEMHFPIQERTEILINNENGTLFDFADPESLYEIRLNFFPHNRDSQVVKDFYWVNASYKVNSEKISTQTGVLTSDKNFNVYATYGKKAGQNSDLARVDIVLSCQFTKIFDR